MSTNRGHPPKFIATAVVLLLVADWASTVPARAEEVECGSLRLGIASDAYDTTCEAESGPDVNVQVLEADALDGTHFFIVLDRTTDPRHIFPEGVSLRDELKEAFAHIDMTGWRTGRTQQGLVTGEFESQYRSVPSICLGFQGHGTRTTGGWRRAIIGFGCARSGDREQLYDGLRHINFPE